MDERQTILVLSLVTIAILVAGLIFFNYMPDDTFITLRYARNVIRGDGFVFNQGERVEGYTNFLWLLILVVVGKLGGPLVISSRLLSFAFSLGTLALVSVASRPDRWTEPPGDPFGRPVGWTRAVGIFLPVMALAASPPFLTWSFSGSEIPLFTFLLLGGSLFVRAGKTAPVFVTFGLLGLVRPEGMILYALAFVVMAVRSRRAAVTGWAAAVAILFYAPYFVWKWRYFGALLPNTFYAKTGPAALMLRNGARYVFGFILSYGYLLFAGLFLLRRFPRERGRFLPALLFLAAYWIEVLALGGDWMPNYRLLLPTLPIVLLVVASAVIVRVPRPAVPVAALILIFLAMVPGAVGYDAFAAERVTVRAFALLGQRLHEILPPGTRIGCGSTGAIGYYTDMPVVDILGLTEPFVARHGKVVGTQPGHLKTDGAFVLERKPDLLLLGNVQIHRSEWRRDQLRLKVQEKEIAGQPGFSHDYEFVNIPLGKGFFLSCFKRKGFFLPL